MSTIDILDLSSIPEPGSENTGSTLQFYQQTTTGDIPPPRIDTCIVAVAAPDNSSYNMCVLI